MLLDSLLNRGALPVLQQVLGFTETRHQILADNVSNFDTVGHQMRDLPEQEFNAALSRAVDDRRTRPLGTPFVPRTTRHYRWDQTGRLQTKPAQIENNNILFHDGNNRFVEKQMSDMAQNAIRHNVAVEMLRHQYNLLHSAISGRI